MIELKLASGMTGGLHRLKDFADVIELIKIIPLSREFSQKLNAYVQPKFLELWDGVQVPLPE